MPMSGKEMLKLYQREGWVLVRINGSHHIMKNGDRTATIPVHGNRDLKRGTEHALLRNLVKGK